MMTMDEYLDCLLGDEPPALRTVVQNILDEPIPAATKKRLLKPLLPQPPLPIPPMRKRKLEKQKVVLQQFDPLYASR